MEAGSPARITVRWAPLSEADWEAALRPRGPRTVVAAVSEHLPNRLAEALVKEQTSIRGRALSQLGRTQRLELIEMLVRGVLPWSGDEGYRKAEVTGGGVSLGEIDAKTMESRKHRGLFLCGEMLDAFGPIGARWARSTTLLTDLSRYEEGNTEFGGILKRLVMDRDAASTELIGPPNPVVRSEIQKIHVPRDRRSAIRIGQPSRRFKRRKTSACR